MKIPTNNITAGVISLLALAMSGTAYVFAGEALGTVAAQSSPSHSSIFGTISTSNPVIVEENPVTSNEETIERSGGRSSSRRSAVVTPSTDSSQINDPVVLLDDGSMASTSGLNGTGGGFDQGLEDMLANFQEDSQRLFPEDAIAFNNSQNPLLSNTDLTATAAEAGVSAGKIWTAIILGLLLFGLSGYAVYSLAGYRKEYEL